MDNIKYCCTDNNNNCNKISLNVVLNKRFAIFTLIFGGDAYLPGVIALGISIRHLSIEKASLIDLCCMVCSDVSESARVFLRKFYDKVIDVAYIEIDPSKIAHRDEKTRRAYSKTFTKMRCFEFTSYDKILFLDADMLVLNDEVFSLFNLNTPAAIFLGGTKDKYFKNANLLQTFQETYCENLHGKLIKSKSNIDLNTIFDKRSSYNIPIETSVFVITPSEDITIKRNILLKKLSDSRYRISGDTELFYIMFYGQTYAIEPRFFGRWINPDVHPEVAILDLYGYLGKPWDIDKLSTMITNPDSVYWWKYYMKIYEKKLNTYHFEMFDNLYKKIKENI